MSDGLIDLISILDLEPLEVNLFRGSSPKTSWQRVFGGQVIGQAMVAACRTVEGRLPHSLHFYFILPGDPQIPIIYEVERLRDGKSYSTRRVTAIQHGQAIFSIMVSFHVEEESAFDHQDKMPDVPPPEKLSAEELVNNPISREVVSPPVPRRRMAALRAGFAERARRPRADARIDLQTRRHAGCVRRARRLDPPAQVKRALGSGSFDQRELRHIPARVPAQHPWNGNQQRTADGEHPRPP